MRIYLDFDGVLHSIPAIGGYFEHLPRFEDVLRGFPAVEVVVSSSWRLDYDFDELRSLFAEDVRHQVIGVTPYIQVKRRVHEIREHMKTTLYRGRFIVLDDAASEFPKNYRPLILCRTSFGLTDVELNELQKRLAGWLAGEAS